MDELKQQVVEAPKPPAAPIPAPREPVRMSHVNRDPRTDLPEEVAALEAKVVEALRQVYDPEIPVNIYDLGLIYEIQISPERAVRVLMTLTAPGCPVAGILPGEAEARVENVPEITSARVELVWDPPWSREMMSEAAKLDLGLW